LSDLWRWLTTLDEPAFSSNQTPDPLISPPRWEKHPLIQPVNLTTPDRRIRYRRDVWAASIAGNDPVILEKELPPMILPCTAPMAASLALPRFVTARDGDRAHLLIRRIPVP